MKTKTTYICDCCGKEFDTWTKCEAHELEVKAKKYNGIKFYNEYGKPLPLDADPAHIYYFSTKTEEEFDYVNKYFNDLGYEAPEGLYPTVGQFFYDENIADWRNVASLYEQIEKIKEVFKSEGA